MAITAQMKKNILLLLTLNVMLIVTAQIPREFAKNVTVYHVNPAIEPLTPINMDTADIRGDMYFDLRSTMLPVECAYDPQARDCTNAEVLNNSALAITKVVIEIDSRTGIYGRCNICVNGTDHHGNNSCTDGVYDCVCGGMGEPPSPCGPAVGVENVSKVHSRGCGQHDPFYECWHDATAKKIGGLWYSTFSNGWCGDGSSPSPKGCTWRVAEIVKRVNKSCSDNIIYNEVEAEGSKCFTECKDSGIGPARNTSSPCWIGCFYDTTVGPEAKYPGGAISGMPLGDLITAWTLPFASDDPSKKGCPALDQSARKEY